VDGQVRKGELTFQLMVVGVSRDERFPDGLGLTIRRDRLARWFDFLGDRSHAEVGMRQLPAEARIVRAMTYEVLVIVQGRIEQLLAEFANIDRILEFEQGIFTDARHGVVHCFDGQVKVCLGLFADNSFAAEFGVELGVLGR
jgi:hypothetical protein